MTSHRVSWTLRFQADVADISKQFALQLLKDITVFATTGFGDVKKLEGGPGQRWRLRSGNYRALFVIGLDGSLLFTSAEHRKDAY